MSDSRARQKLSIGLLLVVAFLAGVSQAAEFRSEIGEFEGTIHISGEIESGDHRQLLKALGDREGGKGTPICLNLNSKGGDLAEALKIGKLSLEKNLSTRLDANAECLGACAIIFMTGTYLSTIGPQQGRHMHPGAILGFQAPSLAHSGAKWHEGTSGEAYAAAVNDMKRVFELARFREYAWRNPLMKIALVHEMLSRQGRDYYFIDTVRKATEFEIELEGAAGPEELSLIVAKRGCENAVAVVANSSVAENFTEFSREGSKEKGAGGEVVYDFPWIRGYCKVTDDSGRRFIGVAEYRGNEIGVSAPAWIFWPGDKELITVPAGTP